MTNHGNLYAACMHYPEDGKILIRTLGRKPYTSESLFFGIVEDVDALGFLEKPVFEQTEEGLRIETKDIGSDCPVIFRIKIR